jgi:SAM-dependent methyltransferase
MRQLIRKLVPQAFRETLFYKTAIKTLVRHDNIYTADYYTRDVEPAAVESAGSMAQAIVDEFSLRSVIDVGCGTGALLVAFRERGCTVWGIEYAEAGLAFCRTRKLDVQKFDIEHDTLASGHTYDAAVSFEVAEHLPAKSADRFVSLLCSFSPTVICSAAKPGQGGTDHVNLQPISYWIDKFAKRGYWHDDISKNKVANSWRESGVASFYYENLMIFRRR